jgi:hypothetical protein
MVAESEPFMQTKIRLMQNDFNVWEIPMKKIFTFIAACIFSLSAVAEVVYETKDPFGGPTGILGADIYQRQSVGIRFTANQNYSLDEIALWFMNNSANHSEMVNLSLRDNIYSDTLGNIPGEHIYEHWKFQIKSRGWEPQLEKVQSVHHPILQKGQSYWIVAESNALAHQNPVWSFSSEGISYSSYLVNGVWQSGNSAALTILINGSIISH